MNIKDINMQKMEYYFEMLLVFLCKNAEETLIRKLESLYLENHKLDKKPIHVNLTTSLASFDIYNNIDKKFNEYFNNFINIKIDHTAVFDEFFQPHSGLDLQRFKRHQDDISKRFKSILGDRLKYFEFIRSFRNYIKFYNEHGKITDEIKNEMLESIKKVTRVKMDMTKYYKE